MTQTPLPLSFQDLPSVPCSTMHFFILETFASDPPSFSSSIPSHLRTEPLSLSLLLHSLSQHPPQLQTKRLQNRSLMSSTATENSFENSDPTLTFVFEPSYRLITAFNKIFVSPFFLVPMALLFLELCQRPSLNPRNTCTIFNLSPCIPLAFFS